MEDRPRQTRPTPRTPAAIEAELRRRLRNELVEARTAAADAGEELDDATLAAIIARAIALALSLHAEAEHVRGPQTTNAGWRSAPGPRGNRPPPRPREYEQEFEQGGPPPRYPSRPRPPFGPPSGPRGRRPPPSRGGGFGPKKPRPR
jgi:hypothetical protein